MLGFQFGTFGPKSFSFEVPTLCAHFNAFYDLGDADVYGKPLQPTFQRFLLCVIWSYVQKVLASESLVIQTKF
jgi:hypothetical protein